ncbi:hypothetical protein FACS189431_3060 [Alphaproteobacteria bacterium]|nr:hypothetical protein FACS189431_3060 [Alphaproteobacteria bacterium]
MVREMAEIIRSVKKKDVVTSVLHIVFNLAVAGLSLGLLLLFPDTPWAAIALVVVSKWRVFAVKPRFWVPNILSNLVDFVFCAGLVVLIWQASELLWLQIALTAVYAAWLILLKPLTKTLPVLLQAGLSQFIGLVALFSVAEYLTLPVTVALAFGIGFAVARHTLMLHEEKQYTLLALGWGAIVAELSFVAYHWLITYNIGPVVKVPEIAIIVTLLGFLVERYYTSFRRNDGQIKQSDVLMPTLFGAALLAILLIFFSGLFGAA